MKKKQPKCVTIPKNPKELTPKEKARVKRSIIIWTCAIHVSHVCVIVLSVVLFLMSAGWMLHHAVEMLNGILVLVVPLCVLLLSLVLGHRLVVMNVTAHRTNIFKNAFTRVAFQHYFDIGAYEYKLNLAPLIRCAGVCCRDWGKMRVNDQVTGEYKGLRFLLLDLCLIGGFKKLFQGQLYVIELPKHLNWRSFDIQTEIVNITHDFDGTDAMRNDLFKEEFVLSYPEQKAGMLSVLSQYGFENADDALVPKYTPDELLNDEFAECLVGLRDLYSGIFLHAQKNYLFVATGSVENAGEDLFEPERLDIFRSYDRIEARVKEQVKRCVDVLDRVICATHMVADRVETVLDMKAAVPAVSQKSAK